MATLSPPSADEFEHISQVQARHEQDARHRRRLSRSKSPSPPRGDRSLADAARLIQKTYRGYRTRRELNSLGLDASTRWITALREVQFRNETRPTGAQYQAQELDRGPSSPRTGAIRKWRKAAAIARRANFDPIGTSESESESESVRSGARPHVSGSAAFLPVAAAAAEHRAARRRKRAEENARRRKEALVMKMEYFLEMVDLKHRHGSNLREYHQVWKYADTRENFFYWLDHGDGRNVDLEACPREQLERERVRYLSREERQYYLVNVDYDGRLCWAKNGARIDTSTRYRDSVHGIVPADDPTPPYAPPSDDGGLGPIVSGRRRKKTTAPSSPPPPPSSSSSSSSPPPGSHSSMSSGSTLSDAAARYPARDLDDARGVHKARHVSATNIINRLLRRTVRSNTWIFVADTNFRLYVGIKASGAFQHSSFLQGSRISAAGLIRVSDGRLRSLSPLSGHYRPPASSFRAFVSSLKADGVDMSRVSVSKSYVVLLGLETYVKTKKKGRQAKEDVRHRGKKLLHPGEARREEEEARDKSESAVKERQALEAEMGKKRKRKVERKMEEEENEEGNEEGGVGPENDQRGGGHGNVATRLMQRLGWSPRPAE